MSQEINIRLQPRLGFTRTFNLTVNGIRYRIFRSSVTVVVISVAIAFMMNVVVENLVKSAMVERSRARLEDLRVEALWTARLISPSSRRAVLMDWAAAAADDPVILEGAGFAGMAADEVELLLTHSRPTIEFLRFIEDLDYGQQRLLLDGRGDISAFDYLADADNLKGFEVAVAETRGLRTPLPMEEMTALMAEWPRIEGLLDRIHAGHAKAIREVRDGLGTVSVERSLREADGDFGAAARRAGFALDAETAAVLAENARASAVAETVEQSLSDQRLRQSVAARLDLMPQEVASGDLWRLCQSETGARWLAARLVELELVDGGEEAGLVAKLRFIADRDNEQRRLVRVERMGHEVGERMAWLIFLSLIVCVVGIANAMLMSVTERYREIATFKCLGALDGSIMLIFVIEASLLGMVGGVIGSVAGTLIGLGGLAVRFGDLAFRGLPFTSLGLGLLLSIVAGIVLAALAAIYPSLKAARLAPMEAMRIE